MENEKFQKNKKYEMFDANNVLFLKLKSKRDQFTHRIDSLMTLPNSVKSKFTYTNFVNDLSTPMLLKKIHFPTNPTSNNMNSNICIDIQQESSALKNEIDEIVNELEFFNRTNRQKRQIKIMEKIAEYINEDLIDVDELLDYKFLGNKICILEKEYLKLSNTKKNPTIQNQINEDEEEGIFLKFEKLKDLKSQNSISNCNYSNTKSILNICTSDKKFSEYTNKLLMDDDEVFVNRISSTGDKEKDSLANNIESKAQSQSQTNFSNKIFKIHQINKY